MRSILAATFFWIVSSTPALADHTSRHIHITKTRGCGCCVLWGEIARKNGFEVTEEDTADYAGSKKKFGVPMKLAACHSAKIGNYVLEGHVPMNAIEKLLSQRPDIHGISVPGMPAGSPGMGDDPDAKYTVFSFNKDDVSSAKPFMKMGE